MNKEDKHVSKSSKKGVSPSDAGQAARTAANKVRNIAKAKVRKHVIAARLSIRWIAGKPIRGAARAARRDAARPAWQAQEGKPLSAFC